MRIEDLRETAQAKIGTRRLEEQPGSRGDGRLASQAHPEADYSRPGGYNSRFPVSISGSECRKCRRWIRCEHSTKGVLGTGNS